MPRQRRGELVAAALTVLRAWHVAAASERRNISALGSFEVWSFRIRETLIWLGKIDPCESLADIRETGPHRTALVTVIMQWNQHSQLETAYTIRQVLDRAILVSDFYAALMSVAASHSGGMVSNDRLGRWLNRNQGKIVNRLRLLRTGTRDGYPLWKLTRQ